MKITDVYTVMQQGQSIQLAQSNIGIMALVCQGWVDTKLISLNPGLSRCRTSWSNFSVIKGMFTVLMKYSFRFSIKETKF